MQDSNQNQVQIIPPGRADIPEDERGEAALLSRIPLQTGDSRKAQYLSWRATGFSVREACGLVPIDEATLRRWRREDQEFADFESKWLKELQKDVSRDLIHLEFMRNMRLALYRDFKVLFKAAYDLDSLSPAEASYLKLIRRMYSPQDMAVLEKVVEPGGGPTTHVDRAVIIQVDGKTVEDEAARRAAAKDLLSKFVVNRDMASGLLDESDGNSDPNPARGN